MSPASLGAIPCGLLLLTRELGAWTRLGLGLLPGPDSSHWACRAHVIGSPLLLTNTSWNRRWPCTVLSGARHARCCVALGKFSLLIGSQYLNFSFSATKVFSEAMFANAY